MLDGVVVNFHLFGIKLFKAYILLDVVVNEAYRLFSLNLHRCFALFPVIEPCFRPPAHTGPVRIYRDCSRYVKALDVYV